ncbi:bifunctional ornithine acetyltransferase/N-acetylglutamate synthase [Terrilactibacillus sp. BCM23-1]|uniref:Arginine biosynthesis bifunctional protein ArgJ n=1 Tax=Terrilactibacillus tamarindi TaxID=2599694 RepID=A0A6N8CQJ7_9BACI|nr:bifunctional ornithine acetyltransferase/N-acetylglutamate synthase [Terrilactibacillus tamarindi]MTT31940.1 bifunctional ornithine acetyltransferase/N-acetylglutamate synthase [Terrilactibacillus tamarindi]
MIPEKTEALKYVNEGSVGTPKGFQSGGLHCGLKYKNLDLGWIYSEYPAVATAVFTTNAFQAAPLVVTKDSIQNGHLLQGVIVNSGNANACTGEKGLSDAYAMRKLFADHVHLSENHVGVLSTGVIGVQLPMDKIEQGIESIKLEDSDAGSFEKAIITTDTMTKHLAVQMEIDGKTVTIGGAAKGSGMIHPNMATMLGFITTDANIDAASLDFALKEITNQTFNMITVDGDTSTNDTVVLMANGAAQNKVLSKEHPEWPTFIKGLTYVSEQLAKKIARDGEGATKLVEVQVTGAKDDTSAKAISKTIVGSSLVKTAIYGTDPNWGRIVCAIGYSGEPLDPSKVSVALGDISIFEKGTPTSYSDAEAKTYLEQENVVIKVDLADGTGKATAWGCDLTYDYVKINASYRT